MSILFTLKADFYRIIKSASGFYSLVGLMILGLFFSFLGRGNAPIEMIENGLGNGTLLLPIFLTNIFVIVWGHDFNYRIVNNALISGIKRYQYFISKVLLTFILTILFIAVYAGSLMVSTYFFEGGFNFVQVLKAVLLQLPLYLTASALGILLFNIFRTSYVAITAFIAIAFIGDNILSSIISTYFSKYDVILDTLFFSNLRNLIDYHALSSATLKIMLISSVIYAGIALMISFNLFQNKEFK